MSNEILKKHKDYLFPSVANYYKEPLAISKGEGSYVYDTDGNKYLDFFGGILTVSIGHCNPKVTERIIEQTNKKEIVFIAHVSIQDKAEVSVFQELGYKPSRLIKKYLRYKKAGLNPKVYEYII